MHLPTLSTLSEPPWLLDHSDRSMETAPYLFYLLRESILNPGPHQELHRHQQHPDRGMHFDRQHDFFEDVAVELGEAANGAVYLTFLPHYNHSQLFTNLYLIFEIECASWCC